MAHPYPARTTRVIHVRGTPFEIGEAHAHLIGDEMNRGMPAFYNAFWKRMIQPQPGGWEYWIHKLAAWAIDPVLVGLLRNQIPEQAQDIIRGLSDGSKEKFEELMTSLVLPDLMPILLSLSSILRPGTVIPAMDPPMLGCSSFFNSFQGLVHGRNLDFPGVGYWDRFPVIQMTQPKKGLRYIGFTTAGVPIAGITGVNELQISVSLHQHYSRYFSLGGVPPFVIGEKILANARNLDEALKILEGSRVSAAWAFLVGDGKSKDAFIYECHPYRSGLIRLSKEKRVLAHSNYFQSAACRSDGYATTGRMNWDNSARRCRLERQVSKESFSIEKACAFLSEHIDGVYGMEKIINRTVSQAYNLLSIVLDLNRMEAWVAEGDCPIHLRSYSHFDLGEIFSGRQGRTGKTVPGYRFQDERIRRAKQAYILSFVASFDGNDALALQEVERSLTEAYSTETATVAGVLRMKVGDFGEAKNHFEGALAWSGKLQPLPPEYFEAMLFLGRVLDLQGQRGEALHYYAIVRNHSDCDSPHLKRLAFDNRPYTRDRIKRVLTPYSSYVPFD